MNEIAAIDQALAGSQEQTAEVSPVPPSQQPPAGPKFNCGVDIGERLHGSLDVRVRETKAVAALLSTHATLKIKWMPSDPEASGGYETLNGRVGRVEVIMDPNGNGAQYAVSYYFDVKHQGRISLSTLKVYDYSGYFVREITRPEAEVIDIPAGGTTLQLSRIEQLGN